MENTSKSLFQFPKSSAVLKSSARTKYSANISSSAKSLLEATSSLIKLTNVTPKESLLNLTKISRTTKNIIMCGHKKSFKTSYQEQLSNIMFPTTSSIIISTLTSLPEWAKQELANFREVFYISKHEKGNNPCLDEIDGEFKGLPGDDILYRYEITDSLGKGTFGDVFKVFDHCEKKYLAMKVIKNKQRFFEQSIIEIELLKYMQERSSDPKNCIVSLEGSFTFRNHMVCII